jgi:hypothetical protein
MGNYPYLCYMKDLSGYIHTLLDGFSYDYQVSFDGEVHVINFNMYDYRFADKYVQNAIKQEVTILIGKYIPEGKIKYLVNVNVVEGHY